MARTKAPSRAEVEARLRAVLAGDETRSHIANWAERWLTTHNPNTSDPAVWKTLVRPVGAELKTPAGDYRQGAADIQAWLDELIAATQTIAFPFRIDRIHTS